MRSSVAPNATFAHDMAREVSVRDLRNHTADVIEAVRTGERVTLTANRRPLADIVPHVAPRDPWVPSAVARAIRDDARADAGLLADLSDVRGALVDEP